MEQRPNDIEVGIERSKSLRFIPSLGRKFSPTTVWPSSLRAVHRAVGAHALAIAARPKTSSAAVLSADESQRRLPPLQLLHELTLLPRHVNGRFRFSAKQRRDVAQKGLVVVSRQQAV